MPVGDLTERLQRRLLILQLLHQIGIVLLDRARLAAHLIHRPQSKLAHVLQCLGQLFVRLRLLGGRSLSQRELLLVQGSLALHHLKLRCQAGGRFARDGQLRFGTLQPLAQVIGMRTVLLQQRLVVESNFVCNATVILSARSTS